VGWVAVLAIVGALAWWFLRPAPVPVAGTEPVAVSPPVDPVPPKVEPPVTPPVQDPAAVAAVQPPPPVVPTPNPTPEPKPSTRPSEKPAKTEVLPEEVRTVLAEAEQALASKDALEAIRIAQRSQRIQLTEAASLLIGRAHCQRGAIGDARTQWRALSSQGKSQLVKYCKQYGITF
jgi:eukaryotic-like serine/threonine-protein kinase